MRGGSVISEETPDVRHFLLFFFFFSFSYFVFFIVGTRSRRIISRRSVLNKRFVKYIVLSSPSSTSGRRAMTFPANITGGRIIGRRTARGDLRHPSDDTRNSNYPEGPLNSTSTSPYRIGAHSTDETVNAARARTVIFMKERMPVRMFQIVVGEKDPSGCEYNERECRMKRPGYRRADVKITTVSCKCKKAILCAHQPVPWKINEY
jgi:hypothetical protein